MIYSVKDLIDKLLLCDPNAKVHIQSYISCEGYIRGVDNFDKDDVYLKVTLRKSLVTDAIIDEDVDIL